MSMTEIFSIIGAVTGLRQRSSEEFYTGSLKLRMHPRKTFLLPPMFSVSTAISAVQSDGPTPGGGDLAATAGSYQTNSQPQRFVALLRRTLPVITNINDTSNVLSGHRAAISGSRLVMGFAHSPLFLASLLA